MFCQIRTSVTKVQQATIRIERHLLGLNARSLSSIISPPAASISPSTVSRPNSVSLVLQKRLMSSSSLNQPLASSSAKEKVTFSLSPVESHKNPLGEGKFIKTAAALVIGDEILNGKTMDTNSHFFAKYCFELGIELMRIEVIPDDEAEIIEAARRLTEKYDFVITSGGIGPTHDDITYDSLAKAFSLPLQHHEETLRRMTEAYKHRKDLKNHNEEQVNARKRMALFPHSSEGETEVLYVDEELWVPVLRIKGKLCVFPGIPMLFQHMLNGLRPYLPISSESIPFRHQIWTTLPESAIAPFLTSLQKRVTDEGIRIGSYPTLRKGVTISLIGRDKQRVLEIGEEVVKEVQGTVIRGDGEDRSGH
ncbi:hypothetical protein FRC03_007337 [Tulasnella sp. 419]|nr:hypothetical protein FRC03_007337 [Tulasnella sp. 419]